MGDLAADISLSDEGSKDGDESLTSSQRHAKALAAAEAAKKQLLPETTKVVKYWLIRMRFIRTLRI